MLRALAIQFSHSVFDDANGSFDRSLAAEACRSAGPRGRARRPHPPHRLARYRPVGRGPTPVAPRFAAWLGLTPKQQSTGGKTPLGRITKRGDAYLRTLLILGAIGRKSIAKGLAGGQSSR